MKFLVLGLLALTATAFARNVNLQDVVDLEDITAYGYLSKVGQPLAERIRKAEAEASQNRITGGSPSALGQFPYQAGLVIEFGNYQAVCGGSLLNARRVLTAAHCWFDGFQQAWGITVVLGSVTLFTGGNRQFTSDVIMHENWTPNLIRNDIAMINLPSAVAFSNTVAPIALPSDSLLNEDFSGETAVASGFGLLGDGFGIAPNQYLSHVSVPVISNLQCQSIYGNVFIQPSNVCSSGENSRGPCSSDSGGPLAINRNNENVLIGVVSFGSGHGCQSGAPSAYARVTYYIDWINQLL